MDIFNHFIGTLPFSWTHYGFMKNALIATILIAPALALLGTMVVSQRLVFFTDVIGHSALAGIGIGVLFGFLDPTLPMMLFVVALSVIIHAMKRWTNASMDTVLGVAFAFVVSLGVVILSRGGFAKYTSYLIGDILTIAPGQLKMLAVILVVSLIFWSFFSNALYLISVNVSLARSRGVPVFITEVAFTALLALVVMSSIKLIGILMINSFLVLPAAASRIFARNISTYTSCAVILSLVCGVTGLLASYYWGTATGATMVLFTVAAYILCAIAADIFKTH
jgi:zinc transport system permease protein